jgi:hypothetical protein
LSANRSSCLTFSAPSWKLLLLEVESNWQPLIPLEPSDEEAHVFSAFPSERDLVSQRGNHRKFYYSIFRMITRGFVTFRSNQHPQYLRALKILRKDLKPLSSAATRIETLKSLIISFSGSCGSSTMLRSMRKLWSKPMYALVVAHAPGG